jgi:hypothetical protein
MLCFIDQRLDVVYALGRTWKALMTPTWTSDMVRHIERDKKRMSRSTS